MTETITVSTASPTLTGELLVGVLAAHAGGITDADDPRLIALALAELRLLAEARGHDWRSLLADAEGINS